MTLQLLVLSQLGDAPRGLLQGVVNVSLVKLLDNSANAVNTPQIGV